MKPRQLLRARPVAFAVSLGVCLLLLALSGCAFHPREADAVLEGVKGDATYNYQGILGGTTAIAEGYENTATEATADRLYLQKRFHWGSSASVDIRNYRRDKTIGGASNPTRLTPPLFQNQP